MYIKQMFLDILYAYIQSCGNIRFRCCGIICTAGLVFAVRLVGGFLCELLLFISEDILIRLRFDIQFVIYKRAENLNT
jgi:hypothetical protein